MRRASYERVVLESNPSYGLEGVEAWNTGEATTSTRAVLPMFALGGSSAVGASRLGWALGAYPPYGGSVDWDRNLGADAAYPGALDGPQRWQAISSSFVLLHYTAALAWTFADTGLSLGGSLSYADASLETTRARNLNREEALVFDDGSIQEGRVWLRTQEAKVNGSVGLTLDRERFLWSAHWRAGYTLRMSRDATAGLQPRRRPATSRPVDVTLPHVITTSFTLRFPKVELTPTLDYSRWSTLVRTDLLSNTDPPELLLHTAREARHLSARVLVSWLVRPTWTLGFSAGVDPSAIPERTNEPGLSDALKFPVGVGVTWDPDAPVRLRLSYTEDIYTTVEVDNSIHEPPANGTYRDARSFVNLSLEAAW